MATLVVDGLAVVARKRRVNFIYGGLDVSLNVQQVFFGCSATEVTVPIIPKFFIWDLSDGFVQRFLYVTEILFF